MRRESQDVDRKGHGVDRKDTLRELADLIRAVPDFPVEGILFRDITPVLQRPKAFRAALDLFIERYRDAGIDAFAGIESRGFLFAAPLAIALNVAMIPIRKAGKLPAAKHQRSYALEYGEATLEIHRDAVGPGQKVVVIDDLLATGGTALAASRLVEECGARVQEIAFLIELDDLPGRKALEGYEVTSFLHY